MKHLTDQDDQDRVKSICEGIRRGLARTVLEPLPSRLEDLLRVLRSREKPAEVVKSHVPASR